MKKVLSLLLVLVLVLSVSVGCGKEDEKDTNDTPNKVTEDNDNDKETENEVTQKPAKIKITSGLWSRPEEQQFIREEILPKFEAEFGIEVELDVIAGIEKVLEAQKASDKWTTDIVITHSGTMSRYIDSDWVQPIDVVKDGLDITVMEAFSGATSKDGKTYYLPISADVYLVVANTKALPFLPSGASMETLTWEQYKQWAINMANEVGPKTTMPALPNSALLYQIGGIALSYGGGFPELNTDAMNSAWALVGDMIRENAILETSFNYGNPVDQMKSEEAWLTFYHMVPVGDVYSSAPAKFEVAPAPAGPVGNGSIAGAWGIGITAGTEKFEAAADFIRFLAREEILYEIAAGTGGFIPPVEEVVAQLGNDPIDIIMKKGLETLENGIVSGVPAADYTDFSAVKLVFDGTFKTIWDNNGEFTQELLDEKQADLENLLK